MRSTAAEVQTTVEVPLEEAFEHIVPIDLTSIFTGYGLLPAVSGTRNQTGAWNAAGQTRTVLLSDGGSAQEALTEYERPKRFAYTVKGFTGALRFLAREARGEWWFERLPDRQATAIRWRYEFVSRTPLVEPLLRLITQWLWRGYMRKALGLSKAQVEAHAV
jgi:Polyketide cyclase / dehydrase and lipid transport